MPGRFKDYSKQSIVRVSKKQMTRLSRQLNAVRRVGTRRPRRQKWSCEGMMARFA